MHCPTEPAIDASSDHAVPWTLVLLPGNGTFQKHMVTCMIHMKLHVQLDLDIHSSIFQYISISSSISIPIHLIPSNIYRSIHLSIYLSSMRTNTTNTHGYAHCGDSAILGSSWKLMGDRMVVSQNRTYYDTFNENMIKSNIKFGGALCSDKEHRHNHVPWYE